MKIALLSDLHANRQALEAVWEHALEQGMQRAVFLGDFVDYGADPVWVLDFVMARMSEGALGVRGNHDEAAASPHPPSSLGNHVLVSLAWTRSQLSDHHRNFLANLPLTARLGPCLMAHANAAAPGQWGYIHGRADAAHSLHATDAQVVFCGHVHEPQLYHLSATGKAGEFTPVPGVPVPLSRGRRWLAIPGSLGQPRDGDPAACYALFDLQEHVLTFHRVPYDHEAAARRVREQGLPAELAERLTHGH